MPRMPESLGEREGPDEAIGSSAESEVRLADTGKPRVLVVDADPALFALLEEWLAAHGFDTAQAYAGDAGAVARVDLIVVDVPFPRHGGADVLHRIASEYPATPVVALSSHFFSRVDSNGNVARALGVAIVLPKPLTRSTFLAAVRQVLPAMK